MMDKNNHYSVGQVLYIVPQNESKVIPVLVVEEITKKTAKGIEVTYKIQSGVDTTKVFLIDNVPGMYFTSPSAAKKSLTEFASVRIAKIVDQASKKAREWYQTSEISHMIDEDNEQVLAVTGNCLSDELEDVTKIQLDDGTVANVKIMPPKSP
jgi:hypothetical protein